MLGLGLIPVELRRVRSSGSGGPPPIIEPDTNAGHWLGQEPAGMAFDFIDMSGVIRDLVTPANNWDGNANAKLTYGSPSAKAIFNSSGNLVSASTLRTEYDGSGAALGVRIESQRTNLCVNSGGTISQYNASNVTDGAPIPSIGSTTAFAFGDNSLLRSVVRNINRTISVPQVFSAFVVMDDGLPPANGDFNVVVGGVNVTAFGILHVGNGVYMVSGSTVPTTTSSAQNGLRKLTTHSARTFRATGFQLEDAATYPTSYIKTAGTALQRNADAIQIPATSFPFLGTSGVLIADYTPNAVASTVTAAILRNLAGSAYSASIKQATTDAAVLSRDAGTTTTLSAAHAKARTRAAAFYSAGSLRVSIDGAAVLTGAPATVPTDVDRLFLGSYGTNSEVLDGWLRRVMYLPRSSVTDAELRAWST